MDPPSYTALNEAQTPMEPEKGEKVEDKLSAAHDDHSTVNSHELHAPQEQRDRLPRGRRLRIRILLHSLLLALVVLFVFKYFRNATHSVRNIFPGCHSEPDAVMHHDDVHLPQDCIEVLDWDHADVPGGYEGYSHVSRASIDLPISSDLLYFLGRGTLSHGVVRFVDSGATGASVANVNVTFLYDGYRLSDSLKICRLHKEGSKNGVGIFSPEVVHHLWNLHSMVVIEVTLPRSAAIKSLETFLPLFSHEVADFQDSVTFGSLALKSANMPIVAKYVATQRTNLQTSNSHISGIFVSNESIDISTSNSFIEGNFYLSNDGVSSTPSRINLHTSNSRIRARISLTSTAENHRNGSFNITTETNNSPLNVQFDTAPVDSRVTFIGRTTNSPISAKLHDSFEGTFSVTTGRWFEAGVHVVNTQDPSGRGRQRYVSRGVSQHGHSEGKVTWGDAGGRRLGHAELSTTNSPAQLYL